METPTSIRVEDFLPLAKLVNAYELQPGNTYLVLVDGKSLSYDAAWALLKNVRECHPDIHVCIVATPKAKSMEVKEHKDATANEA
jgi:hypothetical protein